MPVDSSKVGSTMVCFTKAELVFGERFEGNLVNSQEKFIKMVWTNAKGDIDIFGKAGLSIEKYCLSPYE